MDSLFRPQRQAGFTRVELTAVIAIVGTLSAVALPCYAGMMRSARVAEMEVARGAVCEAARVYRMKWMLAGSTARAAETGALDPMLQALPMPPLPYIRSNSPIGIGRPSR